MSPAFGSNGRSGLYKNQHIKLKNNLKYIDALLVKSELFAFNPDYPIIYPDIEESMKGLPPITLSLISNTLPE
jgi:hypothetical protein